ncbi:MAG: ion transporter [Blautia sp.]|nr:ion transporter [Blautia sp.]
MKQKVFDIIQIGDKSNRISRSFDIFIVINILCNITVMILETFDQFDNFIPLFRFVEYFTTMVFLAEYILRIWTADFLYPDLKGTKARLRFIRSFDGVIDLFTIIPMIYFSGFIVFRMLRVVRIFHLFRINAQYDSFQVITGVLYEKRRQLVSSIFIIGILMLASSLCMYSAEHEVQPKVFSNAFSGIWWSVSAILTVGYGDIYPVTAVGRMMAIIISFLGVGAVAIPTGIISAGFVEHYSKIKNINSLQTEYPVNFVTILISENHLWNNVAVKDTGLPQGLLLVSILRNNEMLIPHSSTKLLMHDRVVLAAESYIDESNLKMQEFVIGPENDWVGKPICELDISRLVTIVVIKRRDKVIIPHGNTVIKAYDKVFLYKKSSNTIWNPPQ